MTKINNSIFKQYLGSLEQFKTYYSELDEISKVALGKALIFIHDEVVDGQWNNDGYIFANNKYYTCRETNLTTSTLLSLIEAGNTSGVNVEEVDGKLVFTAIIKEELKALTSVGFVESGKIWAAGTDIETILNDIFAKEVWYTASFNYAENFRINMNVPTSSITVDGVAVTANFSDNKEIGAPVTVEASLNGSSSYSNGDKFILTCSTIDNNGFVTNGDTSTKLDYLEVGATVSVKESLATDYLTASGNGAFKDMVVTNNTISANSTVTANTNNISIVSNSKTYIMTATPTDDQKVLTTLSNKGKYYDEDTKDGVSIKHTVERSLEENATRQVNISFEGKYKFYYTWGAASLPTIPEKFSGDLTGWTSNWGSTIINNNTPTELNGTIYVLKPTAISADPTIKNEFGQAPATGMTKSETIYTNKYGTTYKLYSFSANGAKYQTLVL